MSRRSIRVASDKLHQVDWAYRSSPYPSQKALATEIGLSRTVVSNFLNGIGIERLNFIEICQQLGLTWEEIADTNEINENLEKLIISYGKFDSNLASALQEFLSNLGIKTSLIPQDLEEGSQWLNALESAAMGTSTFLSLYTLNSIRKESIFFEAGVTWLGKRTVPLLSLGVSTSFLPSFMQKWKSYSLVDLSHMKSLISSLKPNQSGEINEENFSGFVKSLQQIENNYRQDFERNQTLEGNQRKTRLQDSEVLSRGGTNFLADNVVDAIIYIGDKQHEHSDNLAACITDGLVPPTKFLYQSHDGCKQWLDRCNQKGMQQGYTYYTKALSLLQREKNSLINLIHETLGFTGIDLISIGCGNGEKDALLLDGLIAELHSSDQLVFYYPVDISGAMIAEALRNVRSALKPTVKKKLRIKPGIQTDFTKLNPMKSVFEWRDDRPNVWSVLGNTLGNSSERGLLESLKAIAEPGDILLLEVATGDDLSTHYDPNAKVHPQGAAVLAGLGIDLDNPDIDVTQVGPERNRVSEVEGTRTLVYTYKGLKLPGETRFRNATLSHIHYYDEQKLAEHLEEHLGVSKIHWFSGDGVSLFVGQFA